MSKMIGLILNSREYREHDLMLKVLTNTNELLTLVCKGANKITSKRSSSCNIASIIDFEIDSYDNRDMYTVKSINLIKCYPKIYNDLNFMAILNLLFEITFKSYEGEDDEIYNNLLYILDNISNKNMYLLASIYISIILEYLGLKPYVDGCVICDSPKVYNINIEDGGFVCQNCDQHESRYSKLQLMKFRITNKAQLINEQDILKKYSYDYDDLKIMVNFLIHHTNFNLNSFQLLESF